MCTIVPSLVNVSDDNITWTLYSNITWMWKKRRFLLATRTLTVYILQCSGPELGSIALRNLIFLLVSIPDFELQLHCLNLVRVELEPELLFMELDSELPSMELRSDAKSLISLPTSGCANHCNRLV